MDQETTRAQRLALHVLQLGAIAVVIAATTQREFDLDGVLVPKELAVHLTAVVAGLLTLRARITRIDTRGEVRRAAQIDPGSFRAHLGLARSGRRNTRCEHAAAAHALFPNAAAARNLRCR